MTLQLIQDATAVLLCEQFLQIEDCSQLGVVVLLPAV